MPKLWDETIEAHRQAVRDATLDTAAQLVAERGIRAVTMSEIAERTGIGRATLYKYFPDVEAILATWHERQIASHLEHLAEVRERSPEPGRLEAVLTTYAHIQRERARHSHSRPHFSELAALVHDDDQVTDARRQLHRMIRNLLYEAATAGRIRDDIGAGELAAYCMHALEAAGHAPSDAAVRRLVAVTIDGMRSQVDH